MSHTQPQLVKQNNRQQNQNQSLQQLKESSSPLLLFRQQKLYAWGSNKSHSLLILQQDIDLLQSSYDSSNNSVLQPYHPVSFQQVDIIDVSSHFTTSTVLDAQNQIIQFGTILPDVSDYINKQKIQSPLFRLVKIPQNINYRHIVTKVASGDQFTVALTVLGQLFTWGSNGHGQLGIDQPNNLISHTPIKISAKGDLKDQFVQDISCSFNSTLALTRKGQVIAWGYQALLVQPGYSIQSQQFQVNKPTKLKFIDDKVVQISSGRLHHCFVTAKGNCHTFGKNRYWQLGYEQQVDKNLKGDESNFYGRKVEFDFDGEQQWICKQCVSGLDYCVAEIVNAISGQERLVAWGRNKRGQCGVGQYLQQRIKPKFCEFQVFTIGGAKYVKIKQISAGEKHTLLLDDKNQIWACGSTRNGRIASLKSEQNIVSKFQKIPNFPMQDETVEKVVAGESHSFAICSKELKN